MADQPDHCGDQGRLVNVTPREVLAASQIVEFVYEVAVMTAGVEMQRQFGRGDGEDNGREADCRTLRIDG
jgi:hypothetical protein